MPEDKRTDDEKEYDVTKVFKTPEERSDTVLASYNKVVDQYPGTAAAILAKLGQAGAYLDKSDYAHALEAYAVVLASPLATADGDVKGRALEGSGFAKEGKNDLDGALASYKELEKVDLKGYKELAQYHQARVLVAKGDKDKAKELLKAAREKLQQPTTEGKPFPFLEAVVDEALRKIDPSAVPARTQQLGGPKGGMTPEQLEKLIKKAREAGEKKGEQEPH
jgi:predicted negative regulator of RcsB-dependent stress response